MTEIKSNIVDDNSEPDFVKYKIVILGDGAVGKTSLALRFIEDQFGKQYKQTIGVDFFSKCISGLAGNLDVCFQVWDIGGQSIGAKMISNYIYGSDALVFVYDVTNYQSFQNLDDWLELAKNLGAEEARSGNATKSGPLKILMGNKIDLEHLRTVKKDRHDVMVELLSNPTTAHVASLQKPFSEGIAHSSGGGGPPSSLNANNMPPHGGITTAGGSTTSTSTGGPPPSSCAASAASSNPGTSTLGNPLSFFVSAKTGAGVHAAFRAIAAELAGICLSAADTQAAEAQMSANIMDYPRNDPAFPAVGAEDLRASAKSCVVQ